MSPSSERANALREILPEIRSHLFDLHLDEIADFSDESDQEIIEENDVSNSSTLSGMSRRSQGESPSTSNGLLDVDRDVRATRVHVGADLEVKLKRAELRKVDLELKLANSFEKVELARRALEEAQEIHQMYEIEFREARREFERQREVVFEELRRQEEEIKAKEMAAMQSAAIKRAEERRREADASYRCGDVATAEQLYSHAIADLEVNGVALVEPSQLDLRVNRAIALIDLGHTREALSECETVLKIDQNNIKALSKAAQCCLHLKKLEKAQRYIEFVSVSSSASPSDLKTALAQKCELVRALVKRDEDSGDDAVLASNFLEAIRCYTCALKHVDSFELPDSVAMRVDCLSKRGKAFHMVSEPSLAIEDCRLALNYDEASTDMQVCLAQCLLQLGKFEEACSAANGVLIIEPKTSERGQSAIRIIKDSTITSSIIEESANRLLKLQCEDQVATNTIEEIMYALKQAERIAPKCGHVMTLCAEALQLSGDPSAAAELLQDDDSNEQLSWYVRRLCVRARVSFDLADVTMCLESIAPLTQALARHKERSDGHETGALGDDSIKILKEIPNPSSLSQIYEQIGEIHELKESGKSAFGSCEYSKAIEVYTDALKKCKDSEMLQALFLSNICACEQAMERYVDAIASAGAACILAPKYPKPYSRLAAIYTELDMVSDAEDTYEYLLEMGLSEEEKTKVNSYLSTVRARRLAETPINWRKLLGVGAKPSNEVLKKKFRQLALNHHPDKAGRGGASKALASARSTVSSKLFKLINEAYNTLSDDSKVIKWENARVKANYKVMQSRGKRTNARERRSPFGDSNEHEYRQYYDMFGFHKH